jgi:hypothetical protein
MIPLHSGFFSYFRHPVTNTKPESAVSLTVLVNMMCRNQRLKKLTQRVRNGLADKTKELPFFTPAGVFSRRADSAWLTFSGLIHVDIDNLVFAKDFPDMISSQIRVLSGDPFLKPCFIFISPSGKGIKMFVRIKNADASFYSQYWQSIVQYLREQHNVECDKACKDVSRACFICYDPELYYNETSAVDHTVLLERYVPPVDTAVNFFPIAYDIQNEHNYGLDAVSQILRKLNSYPEVHEHAISLLKSRGWHASGVYFKRPGKERGSNSATFRLNPKTGCYRFFNFSSNAHPFKERYSYSDVGVIAQLTYNGNYTKCILALKKYYSHLFDLRA